MEGEVITISEIFKFARTGVSEEGVVMGSYCATGIVPKCMATMKQRGLKLDMNVFSHVINS